MITDADVKKLEKVFATKKGLDSLDSKINNVDKKLDRTINYMNIKFNIIEEKLTKLDSIDTRLASIMDSLAWLTGEYKKFDEEHIVLTEQNSRVSVRLDSHEKRIISLEQRVVTP